MNQINDHIPSPEHLFREQLAIYGLSGMWKPIRLWLKLFYGIDLTKCTER